MIGFVLIVIGFVMFCFAISLETIDSSSTHKELLRIRESANIELTLHCMVLILLVLGFAFFVEESGNPFLLDVFPTFYSRIYGIFLPAIFLILLNIVRHHRFGIGVDKKTGQILAMEQMIEESLPPESGIEEAINIIRTNPDTYDSDMVDDLLSHLSKREDQIGSIARERLAY